MGKASVLVCVTGQKTCDRLIHHGQKLAEETGLPLLVLHVAREGADLLGNPSQSEALDYLYALSNQVGAEMTVVRSPDPLESIAAFAQRRQAAHVVLGVGKPAKDQMDFGMRLSLRLPRVQLHTLVGQ